MAREPEVDPLRNRRERLGPDHIESMLFFVARDPFGFQVARQQITNDLFPADREAEFLLFWSALVNAAVRGGGQLPLEPRAAAKLVWDEATALPRIPGGASVFGPAVLDRVTNTQSGLIVRAFFGHQPSPEGRTAGFTTLDEFVKERRLSDEIRRAASQLAEGEAFRDPMAVVRQLETAFTRATAGGPTGGVPGVYADPNYRPKLPPLFKTGLPWVDRILNGGQAAGEAYVVLAPPSGGKTAFAVAMAVTGVKLRRDGFWHYFSWEANQDELQQRILSYGARIHANTYRHGEPFSTAQTLKGYEYDKVVNNPDLPPRLGELERLYEFAANFGGGNCRLVVHDYSGTRPGIGVGGIDEAIAEVKMEVHRGRPPVGIVIDYAGVCVDRHIAANSRHYKPNDTFTLLGRFVDEVRFKLAIPFACPVWVLHQYHGGRAPISPGAQMHHKDAKGSRNIADSADFAFNFGNMDRRKTPNQLACWVSKTRRAAGQTEPVILDFDGRFCTFTENPNACVDGLTHAIVDKVQHEALDHGPIGGDYGTGPGAGAGAGL